MGVRITRPPLPKKGGNMKTTQPYYYMIFRKLNIGIGKLYKGNEYQLSHIPHGGECGEIYSNKEDVLARLEEISIEGDGNYFKGLSDLKRFEDLDDTNFVVCKVELIIKEEI